MARTPNTPDEPVKGGSGYKPVNQWKNAAAGGWKGRNPGPPKDLTEAAKKAWKAWFQSWWAAFWTPEDLPELEELIRLWDRVHRNEMDPGKLTPLLDRYGITPLGRKQLLWLPPAAPQPGAVKPDVPDEVTARRRARDKKLA